VAGVNIGEKSLSVGLYVLVISMFVYMAASGVAIAYSDYGHECPDCAIAKVAEK
jgi:hypothetical protein